MDTLAFHSGGVRSVQSTFRFGKIEHSATHCLTSKIVDFRGESKKISSACVVLRILGQFDYFPTPADAAVRIEFSIEPSIAGWMYVSWPIEPSIAGWMYVSWLFTRGGKGSQNMP